MCFIVKRRLKHLGIKSNRRTSLGRTGQQVLNNSGQAYMDKQDDHRFDLPLDEII